MLRTTACLIDEHRIAEAGHRSRRDHSLPVRCDDGLTELRQVVAMPRGSFYPVPLVETWEVFCSRPWAPRSKMELPRREVLP